MYDSKTSNKEIKAKEHHFVLVLSDVNKHALDLEDRLFEAGCDDALIVFNNNNLTDRRRVWNTRLNQPFNP